MGLLVLLSAVFAALTAIFAKIGLNGVDSDYATLLRTVVILFVLGVMVGVMGKWQRPDTLPGKALLFLVLSGLATGASWVCYFRALKLGDASKVNPVDKLSVVLVAVFAFLVLGERPKCLGLDGDRVGGFGCHRADIETVIIIFRVQYDTERSAKLPRFTPSPRGERVGERRRRSARLVRFHLYKSVYSSLAGGNGLASAYANASAISTSTSFSTRSRTLLANCAPTTRTGSFSNQASASARGR